MPGSVANRDRQREGETDSARTRRDDSAAAAQPQPPPALGEQRVLLDADLAHRYGVQTRVLVQAVGFVQPEGRDTRKATATRGKR